MCAVCWRSSWLAIRGLTTIGHYLLVLLTHEHHSGTTTSTLAFKVCPAGSLDCLSRFPRCLRTTHAQSLAALGEAPDRHSRGMVKLLDFLCDSGSSHKPILFFVLLELPCTICCQHSCGVTKISAAVILGLVGSRWHSNWRLASVFSWLDESGRSCRVWCVQGRGQHSTRFLLTLVDAVHLLPLLDPMTHWCPDNFLVIACLWCNRSSSALRWLWVGPNIALLSHMAEARLSATLRLRLWATTIVTAFDIAGNADWCWRIHHLFHVLLLEHTLADHLRTYFGGIATPDIFLMRDLNALVILVVGLFAGLRIWTTGEPINTWWMVITLVHRPLPLVRKVCIFGRRLPLVPTTHLRAPHHRWRL